MSIPNFANTTYQVISGEYANSGGPFIVDSSQFDLSLFPEEILNLPSSLEIPNVSRQQVDILKTILTENGRSELFINPFSDEIDAIQNRLGELINTEPSLANSANNILESLDHFETHIDRLSGLSEPTSDNAALPTLEKAAAVGSSLNYFHQILDEAPTNLPQLSMFTSFFNGRSQIDNLKILLAKPSSQISASDFDAISSSLVSSVEGDVNNYFIGLKKLQRMGIGDIIFSNRSDQVTRHLMDSFLGTTYLKNLLNNEDAEKDEIQAQRTRNRLAEERKSRKNTQSFSQDFKTVDDLLQENGLFIGIPMTIEILAKLRELYPANQPGVFNTMVHNRWMDLDTQEKVDAYFSSAPTESFGQFGLSGFARNSDDAFQIRRAELVFHLFLDYVSRIGSVKRGDPYLHGTKRLGSINRYVIFPTRYRGNPIKGATGIRFIVINGDYESSHEPNDAELRDIEYMLTTRQQGKLVSGNLVRVIAFGLPFTLETWNGQIQFSASENPLKPDGDEYVNGIWRPAQPRPPYPAGVTGYDFFWTGEGGKRWEPRYD